MSSEGPWELSFLGVGRVPGGPPCAAPAAGPGVDSVDALLRPAELLGKGALAAPDLRSVLQALVQARHPGPPADEALRGLRNRGRGEDLGGRRRGQPPGPQRHEECPRRPPTRARPGAEGQHAKPGPREAQAPPVRPAVTLTKRVPAAVGLMTANT